MPRAVSAITPILLAATVLGVPVPTNRQPVPVVIAAAAVPAVMNSVTLRAVLPVAG